MINLRKAVASILFLSLVLLAFTGCSLIFDAGNTDKIGSTDSNGDSGDYMIGIRGIIKDINRNGSEATILVEGKIEADTVYDKASVRINADTMIQKDNLSRLFEISDLRVGNTVEVIFAGPVAESYPVQGTAEIVRIITQK